MKKFAVFGLFVAALGLLAYFVHVFDMRTSSSPDVSVTEQNFMTLDEVRNLLDKGPLYGVFETVLSGTTISKHAIRVEGIYSEPGLELVMFTTSEKIAAGMSGSPVYVNGKLSGALAYSFNNFTEISWGGISPITLMKSDAESQVLLGGQTGQVRRFSYKGKLFKPIDTGTESLPDSFFSHLPGGLSEASAFREGKFLVSSQNQGSGFFRFSAKELKAGMPIVVDLASWTDQKARLTTVSAMGTITYIDRKSGKIYAFGHPYLGARNVHYTFRTCKVIGTTFSEFSSYKIAGEKSDVLGTIDFDSDYGVYGKLSLESLPKLNRFEIEMQRRGQIYNRLKVEIADCRAYIPLLVDVVLSIAGGTNNAPLPQETSTTELEVKIDLKGHDLLSGRRQSSSESFEFGSNIIYLSSYDVATKDFISNVYLPLLASSYNFEISNVALVFNFLNVKPQELQLVARFPSKLVWGEDPVLEVLLVGKYNLLAFEKRLTIKIDWDKVEKPIYDKNTLDTEKKSESIVGGALLFISNQLIQKNPALLSEQEREKMWPKYFLSVADFLKFFQQKLQTNDQRIYARINLRAKSGLFDEKIAGAESILSAEAGKETDGWHLVFGGIRNRKETIKKEGSVTFQVELPPVLSGYIVNPFLLETSAFEVVKK